MDWKRQKFPSGQTYEDFIQNLFNERIPFREAHRRLSQGIDNDTSNLEPSSSSSSSTQKPGMKRPLDAPEEPKPSKMDRQEEPEAPIPEEHPFVQRVKRERVSYYPGIYDPQTEFPETAGRIIQIEQVRDFYEELAQAAMVGYPHDEENFGLAEIANIWDLLFFRMISPQCCKSAENFIVNQISNLKLVIGLETVRIEIKGKDGSKTSILYRRNDQGKEEVKCDNQIVEYDTPSYKILAAYDMPQEDVRFVDNSLLKITTGLITDKKPNNLRVTKFAYMFIRESDVLDEDAVELDTFTCLLEDRDLKTVKLRAWDDAKVFQANNYPNMAHNCQNFRYSVHCALPTWNNVETLDIRDDIVFFYNVPRLPGYEVWGAQDAFELGEDEYQQYTVISDRELDLDEILKFKRDTEGKFDKDPPLDFPLTHTRVDKNGKTYVLEIRQKQIKVTVRPTMEND